MFGYVILNKPEIKFREFDEYRSYYCGLCSALRKKNVFSAFSLSYDLTFLYMLLSSLYEEKCVCRSCRCVCHPFKKHAERVDCYADYAADMAIILSYYKCLDDFRDDKNIIKYFYSCILSPSFKKAEKKYADKSEKIKASLAEIARCEGRDFLEGAANAFGEILRQVFTPHDDMWKTPLGELGFYLGKFIYIMDSYDDLEEDIKRRRPNPLKKNCDMPNFDRECENLLNMMGAEAASRLEYLPIVENAEILKNIIYGGIWVKFEQKRSNKIKKKTS